MNEVLSAALVGSLIGTFFGGFTKFLWETWLPERLTWRRQQKLERERQLASVRAPALLALSDLHFRLKNVAETKAANFTYVRGIGEPDYYVNSTAYLVARAFAWQEVLRQRMAALDYAELYQRLESSTEAFSHGGKGFQVFRLEQREIAERMIATSEDAQTCLPFSEFLDLAAGEEVPRWLSSLQRRVTALLEDPERELDRVESMDRALVGLVSFLDPRQRWQPASASRALDAAEIRQRWSQAGTSTRQPR